MFRTSRNSIIKEKSGKRKCDITRNEGESENILKRGKKIIEKIRGLNYTRQNQIVVLQI